MQTSRVIETDRLELVPFNPAQHLNDAYVAWLNNPDIVQYSEQRHKFHTLETCAAFAAGFNDSPSRLWAIVQKTNNMHIGNIHADIDPHNGIADVAILLGARDIWGQGYGLEAWNGVLDFLKPQDDIRKIVAGCMRSNAAMYSIMSKSGMIDDGQRQKHYLLNGKPEDIVFFALHVTSYS